LVTVTPVLFEEGVELVLKALEGLAEITEGLLSPTLVFEDLAGEVLLTGAPTDLIVAPDALVGAITAAALAGLAVLIEFPADCLPA
jgi:hypothetical protein